MNITTRIFEHLGGNTFTAMVRPSGMLAKGNKLAFRFPEGKDGINAVEYELNGFSLYEVTYLRIENAQREVIKTDTMMHGDCLRMHFHLTTGIATKLEQKA